MSGAASIWTILDSGWGVAFMLGVALIIVYIRQFRAKAEDVDALLNIVKGYIAKDAALSEEISETLEKHCNKCLEYHTELSKFISTDRWVKVSDKLIDLAEDVNRFVHEGKDSREVTQSIVAGLVVKLDALTLEIISTLRAGMGLRNGANNKD